MKNQTTSFSRKALKGKGNIYFTAFSMLVLLANCTNNINKDKIESANSSLDIQNEPLRIRQKLESYKGPNDVYTYPDKYPQFIGGIKKFKEFMEKNLHYPEWEKRQKIEGRVFVTFVVEKDGNTSTFQVARIPNGSINLGNEAVRVLRSMPRWTPGEIEGKKVRVRYAVPIEFKLP